jgi:hypothetical protein
VYNKKTTFFGKYKTNYTLVKKVVMSTMMLKISEFIKKYEIPSEGEREMINILNESLLEISRVIMSESKNKESALDKSEKRYKSKKAEEYAEEHGLSLEDFKMKEVSKKDVEVKVREITKEKKEYGNKSLEKDKTEKKSEDTRREKVICSGINKKGEACKSTGTIQPEGAKKKYCFRHAEDYKLFECDSDSSDEENGEIEESLEEEEYLNE